MPRPFSVILDAIVGYLNGAGLGALLIELLSSPDRETTATLVALFVMGPFGALLGLLERVEAAPANTEIAQSPISIKD